MCGISGLVGTVASSENIMKMTQELDHRGRDHVGYKVEHGKYALGHNRLSIIELNNSANQPFLSRNKRFSLVFNGEIYNYLEIRNELEEEAIHFKTSSDTEVLLQAYIHWGENCLDKFNGMFAFAILDHKDDSLFLARDRFGVKPLYYTITGDNLIFASEIKAILPFIKKKVSKKVLANYLAFGSYGLPEETFFENIYQLPGGCKATFNKQNLNIIKWYDFVNRAKKLVKENHSIDWVTAKQKYKEILDDSLKLRFRADVPVGFNLSGGVDSSLLLALVNQRKDAHQVEAFTFYTGDDRYDELYWVEKMVELTKTHLNKVKFEAKDFKEWHEHISHIQDEPYGGIPTLAYAKLFQTASDKNIKVLLDGQGMDEAWAGYDYYQNNSRHTIQGQNENISPFKTDCLQPQLRECEQKPDYPKPFESNLLNKQYRDLFYTKIPRALRFNDRISMAATTELREPFLDYRLVEFAFSLPRSYKINNGQGKYMLRQLLGSYNAEDVALAPKRPLQTPQREWLAGGLKSRVESAIVNIEQSKLAPLFSMQQLKKEWHKYQQGEQETILEKVLKHLFQVFLVLHQLHLKAN